MVLRVLAWFGLIFGVAISLESTLVAHHPNLVWLALLALSVLYFVKNGFLKAKTPS